MKNYNELMIEAAALLESHEHYQKKLGAISSMIANEYGVEALEGFANDLKETHGISVSVSTLKNYRYVYEKVGHLNLPNDISYRTLQYIASSGRPEYWAGRIEKEGLSSAEVYRMLREEKGMTKKPKSVICPKCGEMFEVAT